MSLLLFSNRAITTIAGAISSGATSVNLAAGTGSMFPNPGTGQYFVLTFVSQSSATIYEIVNVTARTGDTLTIVRGQEGTSPLAWNAGDTAANYWTAASANAMVQVAQLQQQAGNYAADTGAVNAYAVTLAPVPASLASIVGSPIRVKIANTNTGSSTLSVNGLTALISGPGGTTLNSGTLLAGQVVTFVYDGTSFECHDVLAVGGTLSGTLPNPSLAAGAAATNLGFTPVQQGGGASQGGTKLYLGYDGTAVRVQAGGTDLGEIATLPVAQTWTATQTLNAGAVVAGLDANGAAVRVIGGSGVNAVAGIFRNDGVNFYTMLSAVGTPLGAWNSLRPISINVTTGAVMIDGTGAGVTIGTSGSTTTVLGALAVQNAAASNQAVALGQISAPMHATAYGVGTNTTVTVNVSFTVPSAGILFAVGSINKASQGASSNNTSLSINGTAVDSDNTELSITNMGAVACSAGPASASYTVAAVTSFTTRVMLIFIPNV